MPYQLCSSCRHTFPASSLERSAFKETVAGRLAHAQSLLESISGRTPADTHALQQLRLALRDVAATAHEEAAAQGQKLETAEHLCARREKDLEAASAKMAAAEAKAAVAAKQPNRSGTLTGGSLFSAAAQHAGPGGDGVNRTAFGGAVPAHQLRKMNSALELVSASIYSIVESLAIQARVDTAVLWLRPRGFVSLELVGPFVVGRDVRKMAGSAPYRVPEVSIPCAASSTGIAVNIKPRSGTPTEVRHSEDIPLTELIEKSNAAQLLMPVYSRYRTQGDEAVIAVVHLIGSPRFPVAFTRRNEHATMQAAAFLSTILSAHHETMIGEWGNHFYDPSVLRNTSTYRGDLDLRGDEKALDDFSPPEMLIYRCVNERSDSGPGADPREAYKALKHAIGRRAVPVTPVHSIQDLHRYATRMETNWVSAVETTSHLEHVIGSIKAEALQEEVQKLREQREKAWSDAERIASQAATQMVSGVAAFTQPPATPAPAPALPLVTPKKGSLPSAEMASAPVGVEATDAADLTAPNGDLKYEQVEQLEATSLHRLRQLGVDTRPFLT